MTGNIQYPPTIQNVRVLILFEVTLVIDSSRAIDNLKNRIIGQMCQGTSICSIKSSESQVWNFEIKARTFLHNELKKSHISIDEVLGTF